MLTYTIVDTSPIIIAIHDSTITLHENTHIHGKDYFNILLGSKNTFLYTLQEIQQQLLETNKPNNLELTKQRIAEWSPIIQQALTELV